MIRSVSSLVDAIASDAGLAVRKAFTFTDGRAASSVTYGELIEATTRIAYILTEHYGIRFGDKVAILSENALWVPIAMLAILRLGATLVPLNPKQMPEDWAYIIEHAGVTAALVDPATRWADAASSPLSRPINGQQLLATAAATPASATPWCHGVALDRQLGVILYTSGTTGRPKGVMLSQAAVLANADSLVEHLRLESPVHLAVLPLYHAHAMGLGLFTTLLSRGHLVFTNGFNPLYWINIITQHSVTVTSLVPSLLNLLLKMKVEQLLVPSLGSLIVSSAPLHSELATKFESQTGIPLIQGWGLSEFTNFATCLPLDLDDETRFWLYRDSTTCIGIPLSKVDVRLGTPGLDEAAEGDVSEFYLRGPSIMDGYLDNALASRETIIDGWLKTGDLGFYRVIQGRRFYFISGRKKETIIRLGDKISPLRVEHELLRGLPELTDQLAVVGFAHEVLGEEIGVYVECGHDPMTLAIQLREHVAAMPEAYRPRVVLIDSIPIPRTHTGKCRRNELAYLFGDYFRVADKLLVVTKQSIDRTTARLVR